MTYQVHAGAPRVALDAWKIAAGPRFLAEWNGAVESLIDAYSTLAENTNQGLRHGRRIRATGTAILHHDDLNVLAFRALHRYRLDAATLLLAPLVALWKRERLFDEVQAWLTRAHPFVHTLDGDSPARETAAGGFWSLLTGAGSERVLKGVESDWGSGALRRRQLGRIRHCRVNGDPAGLGRAWSRLGDIAWAAGDLEEAERYHMRALEVWDLAGDTAGQAATYLVLGRLARARGDLNGSDFWLNRALRTQEAGAGGDGLPTILCSLALNASMRGDRRATRALVAAACDLDAVSGGVGSGPKRAEGTAVPGETGRGPGHRGADPD